MMKAIHCIALGLATLASVNSLVAQSSTDSAPEQAMGIVYKFTSTMKRGGMPISKSCFAILQIQGSQVSFADYARYQADSVAAQPNVTDKQINEYAMRMNKAVEFFEPVIYDLPQPKAPQRVKGESRKAHRIGVLDAIVTDRFSYEEEILYSWELGVDEREIGGYTCNKAVLHYGGREWIAWYTPDIPISQGPWKLKGLPGLILQAESADGAFRFDLASIYTSIQFAMSPKPTKSHIPTDRKSFVEKRNQIMDDPMKNTPPSAISSLTVLKHDDESKSYLINDIRIANLAKGDYVPMEAK